MLNNLCFEEMAQFYRPGVKSVCKFFRKSNSVEKLKPRPMFYSAPLKVEMQGCQMSWTKPKNSKLVFAIFTEDKKGTFHSLGQELKAKFELEPDLAKTQKRAIVLAIDSISGVVSRSDFPIQNCNLDLVSKEKVSRSIFWVKIAAICVVFGFVLASLSIAFAIQLRKKISKAKDLAKKQEKSVIFNQLNSSLLSPSYYDVII